MITNCLDDLSSKQLMSILRQVQHGHDHLSRYLSQFEYENLLSLGKLSNNQVLSIKSDHQEKIGNVSIVVNTILTSCFGAYLGFNAFNGSSIISIFGLMIIMLALSLGVLIGYLSYSLTQRQAKLTSIKQKLCNVERIIIEMMIKRKQAKLEILLLDIQQFLLSAEQKNKKFKQINVREMLADLEKLQINYEKSPFLKLIEKALSSLRRSVKSLEVKEFITRDMDHSDYNPSDFLLNDSLTNASYIKTLTKTDMPCKHQTPKLNGWLRKNVFGILVGLLPTFLGSFASMFVFLNGFPAMFSSLGFHFGFSQSEVFIFKEGTLLLALSISLYFAYSHIHSNYRNYKRIKQLDISEKIVAEKTNDILQLLLKLNHWHNIWHQLKLICDLKLHPRNDFAQSPVVVPITRSHLPLRSGSGLVSIPQRESEKKRLR